MITQIFKMITEIIKRITAIKKINLRNLILNRWNQCNTGQTATELAIFGAVLVFVLGLLIKYALNFNFAQELPMKAFRKAAQMSSGSFNRRFASVVILEDKDLPDVSDPLAIAQRNSFAAQGSTSFNNLLYAEMLDCDDSILPITDMFINGKHYSFTTAGCEDYDVPSSGYVRTKVTENDPGFNVNQIDPAHPYWQWKWISADEATIIPDDKENVIVDADEDGKEEVVVKVFVDRSQCVEYYSEQECIVRCEANHGNERECCDGQCQSGTPEERRDCRNQCIANPENYGCREPRECEPDSDYVKRCKRECKVYALDSLRVLDKQEGDIDLTIDSSDIEAGRITQGLRPDQQMEAKVEPGSQHRREENAAQIKNTVVVKRKDKIERIIQLNPRVGCSERVRAQMTGDDYCDSQTGELHVFSKPEFKKTRVWTTPH